ncbi:MAG: hypothetical protein K9L86_06575 [Candidatus Omnitrophica bacterium]|nr:hypothetical protein [Candidatus Omnitrophota bacterium]
MKDQKFSQEEIKDGAPFAALSYVGILWILTFILKKDNAFARFHARQGIVISVGLLGSLPFLTVPILGRIFGLLSLILVVASIYGAVLSLTGKTDKIYLISDIAKRLVV